MPGSEPFEAWLDRALPAAVQSELGPSPRAWQATYRRPPTADPAGSMAAILIRGVALGAAVSVAVGAAAAALTTSGTVDLGTWEQALIAVVQGCPDAWHGQDRCGGPAGTPAGGQPRNDRPSDPGGPQVGAPVPVGTGRSPTSGPGRQPPSGGPLASPTAGAPGVPSPSPSPSPSP